MFNAGGSEEQLKAGFWIIILIKLILKRVRIFCTLFVFYNKNLIVQ